MKRKTFVIFTALLITLFSGYLAKVLYLKYANQNLSGFDYFMLQTSDFEHDQHWYCYHKSNLKIIHEEWACDLYDGACGEIKIVTSDNISKNVFILNHAVSGEIALDLATAIEKELLSNNRICVAGDQGILSQDGELLINFYKLKSWGGRVDYMHFS